MVTAHAWLLGLGQHEESGAYLNPETAVNWLAEKLKGLVGGNITVIMVAADSHKNYMAQLDALASVLPVLGILQARRMAQSSALHFTDRMQIPARTGGSLPVAAQISAATSRQVANAKRIADAKIKNTGCCACGPERYAGCYDRV